MDTNELEDGKGAGFPLSGGLGASYDDRYQAVQQGYWWRVRIGDGQQTVGKCHTKLEADRLAAALLTAFRDGQFSVSTQS
jgi:hypothetical protein